MAMRHAAILTALAVGLVLPVTSCTSSYSGSNPMPRSYEYIVDDLGVVEQTTAVPQDEIQVPSESKLTFDQSRVTTVPAPIVAHPAEKTEPEPEPAEKEEPAKVKAPVAAPTVAPSPLAEAVPVIVAPQPAPVPAAPVQPVTPNIHVGLKGGQDEVDKCKGPVKFTPVWETVMVVEHDSCGGWARFGNMKAGSKVTVSGQVNGTYKIGKQVVVNKGSLTNVISEGYGEFPPLLFQTCIPGTNRMVLTAAYPV